MPEPEESKYRHLWWHGCALKILGALVMLLIAILAITYAR